MKITSDSHLDHALPSIVVEYIAKKYETQQGFLIDTFDLPAEFPAVPCSLVGPATGADVVAESDVTYQVRSHRTCASRMCTKSPPWVRQVTVIMGEHAGETVLFTAYGGPCAPREPGDPAIADWSEMQRSRAFWSEHALARVSAEGAGAP